MLHMDTPSCRVAHRREAMACSRAVGGATETVDVVISLAVRPNPPLTDAGSCILSSESPSIDGEYGVRSVTCVDGAEVLIKMLDGRHIEPESTDDAVDMPEADKAEFCEDIFAAPGHPSATPSSPPVAARALRCGMEDVPSSSR